MTESNTIWWFSNATRHRGTGTRGPRCTRAPKTLRPASSTTDPTRRRVWLASRPSNSSPPSRAPGWRGGPVDPARTDTGCRSRSWARATLDRFTGIGVRVVFSHGTVREAARHTARPAAARRADVAHAQPRRLDAARCPRRRHPAGHRRVDGRPRTALLSPEAVLANLSGLVARSRRGPIGRCRCPGCRSTTTWG